MKFTGFVTPKPALIELLEANKTETTSLCAEELVETVEIQSGERHFYFRLTCITTTSEGLRQIHDSVNDYFKFTFLAYLYDMVFCGDDDLLFEIFGDVKFSIDFFDTYWGLHCPGYELNTDDYDEVLIEFKEKFEFREGRCFDNFLEPLGLTASKKDGA